MIPDRKEHLYILTTVADTEIETARNLIRNFHNAGWFAFSDAAHLSRYVQPGNQICFYEVGVGVVAEAKIASLAERGRVSGVKYPDKYTWIFKLIQSRFFFDKPVILDSKLRASLDSFLDKRSDDNWGWFVRSAHSITRHDFLLLTGR